MRFYNNLAIKRISVSVFSLPKGFTLYVIKIWRTQEFIYVPYEYYENKDFLPTLIMDNAISTDSVLSVDAICTFSVYRVFPVAEPRILFL